MIGRALALTAMILLATTRAVLAQDDEPSDGDRDAYEEEIAPAKATAPYVEFLVFGGFVDDKGLARVDPGRGGGGGGAVVGVHIEKWVAVEGEYEFLSNSATHLATGNVKLVPLPDSRLQPYLKAGIGLLGGRGDHAFRFLGRFDLGAAFFIESDLALDLGVTAGVATHDKQVYLGHLGLIYYFE